MLRLDVERQGNNQRSAHSDAMAEAHRKSGGQKYQVKGINK
jgi:hypothetical protein